MKKIFVLIFLISILLISCKTQQGVFKNKELGEFEFSNLPGMIYDAQNRPCSRVSVSVWKSDVISSEETLIKTSESDINGRFTILGLERGNYRVVAEKEGFESIETEIFYSSRLDVLYLKIYSQKQILDQATDAMSERRYGLVEELLQRAENINKNDPYFLYMKSVYLYGKKEFSSALVPLENIQEQGFKFPHVFLLMADIYQYKLDQPDLALIKLKEYINLIDDSEINLRIRELEKK